ncbi:expressed unknown protein [Seminavis robusta]|uniref:Uncharacterized protein n=1 Tax=Seminavis robusta TaxID=568900 RepID=A0A9N8EIT1_9STRA|nr:expressed unknown protein [Seminavis robusta]|eukprot:Sro1023_g232460.1 n/a (284) ;mRNA; f:3785-4636
MNITAYPIDQSVNDAAMVLLGLNHKTSSDAQRLELTRATARSEAPLLTKRQCSTTYLLRKRPLLHDTTLEQQPTKRMRPMKRSARFGDDPSVAPSVQLHVFESVDHENANLIWWTRDEIRHIHRRERAMIGVLSQCCGFYVEQLACLTRVSFEDTVDLSKETSYAWVADSPGRGLETQVAAVLTGSTDKARIVTRKVLEAHKLLQKHLSGGGQAIAAQEQASDILRARYEDLSLRSKRWAQLLAAGDALVARLDDGGINLRGGSRKARPNQVVSHSTPAAPIV